QIEVQSFASEHGPRAVKAIVYTLRDMPQRPLRRRLTRGASLALAPPLAGLVRPPGAAFLGIVLHLGPVEGAEALLLGRRLAGSGCGGWLRQWVALEQRLQPERQPRFVRVAQGPLHLAPVDGQAHVHTGWCLWQGCAPDAWAVCARQGHLGDVLGIIIRVH